MTAIWTYILSTQKKDGHIPIDSFATTEMAPLPTSHLPPAWGPRPARGEAAMRPLLIITMTDFWTFLSAMARVIQSGLTFSTGIMGTETDGLR
jgi:hypothetical protein